MNDFSDLLRHDTVLTAITATNKKALLQHLATIAADAYALDAKQAASLLIGRERVGSTGFGSGVALPHAKIEGLDQVAGLFARLDQPIEFDAIDDLPVDLVFVLLSPMQAGAAHLKALSRISRRLRDQAFLAKLRGAGSRDALYALFTADASRDAA